MDTAAVLFSNNAIHIINMEGQVVATLNKHRYTSICWSSKGKQIACGSDEGDLYQIDPSGVVKKTHLANPENKGHRGNKYSSSLRAPSAMAGI